MTSLASPPVGSTSSVSTPTTTTASSFPSPSRSAARPRSRDGSRRLSRCGRCRSSSRAGRRATLRAAAAAPRRAGLVALRARCRSGCSPTAASTSRPCGSGRLRRADRCRTVLVGSPGLLRRARGRRPPRSRPRRRRARRRWPAPCENDAVGAPTGGMDQLVSLRGVEPAMRCSATCATRRPGRPARASPATGCQWSWSTRSAPHRHSDGEYGARRRGCEEAARQLGVRALRDVAGRRPRRRPRAARRRGAAALRRGHVRHRERTACSRRSAARRQVGSPTSARCSTASHASMRDDFRITVPEVDRAVGRRCWTLGALGARMTGGGFGGCVIALVPAESARDGRRRTPAFPRRRSSPTSSRRAVGARLRPRYRRELRTRGRPYAGSPRRRCSKSSGGMSWPMPSMSTSSAPGTAAAVDRPPLTWTILSAIPWMTRVGMRRLRSRGVRSGWVSDGEHLPHHAAGADAPVEGLAGARVRRAPRWSEG